jgi:hypothetical protein
MSPEFIKKWNKEKRTRELISLVRSYVFFALSVLVSASATVAIIDRRDIDCTDIETDRIDIHPAQIRNACTSMALFLHTMVDRLNFFVMNISLLLDISIP